MSMDKFHLYFEGGYYNYLYSNFYLFLQLPPKKLLSIKMYFFRIELKSNILTNLQEFQLRVLHHNLFETDLFSNWLVFQLRIVPADGEKRVVSKNPSAPTTQFYFMLRGILRKRTVTNLKVKEKHSQKLSCYVILQLPSEKLKNL